MTMSWIQTSANTSIMVHSTPDSVRKLWTSSMNFNKCWTGCLGCIYISKHHIKLTAPDVRPVDYIPYCTGLRAREFKKTEFNKMLCTQVIEPAQSEWASLIVFAPKKDSLLRFCIDYRILDAFMINGSYPNPRMDEFFESLG